MQLEGKTALVTGGGSGIGAATCRLLAREGARVAMLSRTRAELEAVAASIREAGGEAVAFEADVSNPEDLDRVCRDIGQRWGRLDLVFANAGINGLLAPLDEIPPAEWQKTVAINLNGTFYTIRAALPLLKKRGGAILITSSINGNRKFTSWGSHAYSATKAGQISLMKTAALELAKHRIRVNAVCPGAIDTEIEDNTEKRHLDAAQEPVEFPEGNVPLTDGAPGKAEQVAELALFLLSDRAAHITGTEVYIDGAESLLEG